MTSEFFTNATQFILAIFALCVIAGVFAAVIYILIRGQLSNIKALIVTGKDGPLPGIPFYIKKGLLIQETSYLETLATYTLMAKRVTLNGANERVREEIAYNAVKTVSHSEKDIDSSIVTIRASLLNAQQEQTLEGDWVNARETFEGLPQYLGKMPEPPFFMEGNTIKDSSYVDYGNTFYLNKIQPISGSSELEVDLSADGTLTKSIAKSEDTTLEKLLGFLAVDKMVSQLGSTPVAEEAAAVEEGFAGVIVKGETTFYEFSLAFENRLIRHIRYKEIKDLKRSFQDPLPLNNNENWYRREIVTNPAPEPEKPVVEPAAPSGGTAGDNSL